MNATAPGRLSLLPARTTIASLLALTFALPAVAATLYVGPGKTYATPCQALTRAVSGDTVLIDGGKTYAGDVCAFSANNLLIRGVNGRPRIDAAGQYAQGKGTWVIGGSGTTIENVEMTGAKVPDRNGAALRLDGMHLTLRYSHLHHNENGILTNNDGVSNIVIEGTEFGFNGYGDGYSHNVYIGHVKSLLFRNSYSHDANVGHNLKSRANTNTITANRFSSSTGNPSYEIDLPNAGTALILGNVIQQPASSSNSGLVSYGTEGASNTGKDLYVVNNTFINDRSSGATFLLIGSGVTVPAIARNNLFVGTGTFSSHGSTIDHNNLKVASYPFVNRAAYDLRPTPGSQAVNNGVDPGKSAAGTTLTPAMEHIPVAHRRPRVVAGKIDIGAYESTSAPVSPYPTAGKSANAAPEAAAAAAKSSPDEAAWTPCAQENGTCGVPGVRTVRYGADGKFNYKTVTGQVSCNDATFGNPAPGVLKACAFDASAARTWSLCAVENASCAVDGTRQVRFGANGQYFYSTVTGKVSCSAALFGDPAPGQAKSCDVSSN